MQLKMIRKWGYFSRNTKKIDFKTNSETKDKKGHYIMIKILIQQEEIRFINVYAPSRGAQDIQNPVLMDMQRD